MKFLNHTQDQRRHFQWLVWGIVAIAAAYLLVVHRAHILVWIPYTIFLACPLMHLFHGHHHGSHKNREHPGAQNRDQANPQH